MASVVSAPDPFYRTQELEMLRTHDDVAALIRATIPGARVEFRDFIEHHPKTGDVLGRRADTRRYEIHVERIGRDPVNVADTYSLPLLRIAIQKRVRELADYAMQCAERGVKPCT